MVEKEIKEEVGHMNSLFGRGSTSFRPLGEIVSDYYDVFVSPVSACEWANKVNANLFPTIVGNWYRV